MMLKSYEKLSGGNSVFRLFAPDAQTVDLNLLSNPNSFIPMKKNNNNVFEVITNKAVKDDLYYFRIDNNLLVPDSFSKYQPQDVHGPTQIYESKINADNDSNWAGIDWKESIIYELHIGTFTTEGTFKAAIEKLDYIKSIGINTIELMPVTEFPGTRNWGYDGVLLFAPDASYGTPDELKELIIEAHKRGIQVFLDVVYNHFGPDGNYLYLYAKSEFFKIANDTNWGDAINFKSRFVRDFYIQNTLYWFEEYGFDGLRFDAIHAIYDDSKEHILDEISRIIKNKYKDKRKIHLMLENDNNNPEFLKQNYSAQWNDDAHHAVHVAITGEKSGYYIDYTKEYTNKSVSYYLARTIAEGFAYQGDSSVYRNNTERGSKSSDLSPSKFIIFLQNHDQIGNRLQGERISELVKSQEALKAAIALNLLSPSIPLLFMGEEWAATTPFLFFCDFDAKLSKAVKEGREKELENLAHSKNMTLPITVPDPTSIDTFNKSKLDWHEQSNENSKKFLEFYTNLIKIRKENIIPIIDLIDTKKTSYKLFNDFAFMVNLPLKSELLNGRQYNNLSIIANFSPKKCFVGELQFKKNIYMINQGEIADTLEPWSLCLYMD